MNEIKQKKPQRKWQPFKVYSTSDQIAEAKLLAKEVNQANGGQHLRNSFTEGEQTALGLLGEIVLENAVPCLQRQERLQDAYHHDMLNVDNQMLLELKAKATTVPTVSDFCGSIALTSWQSQKASIYGMLRGVFPQSARSQKECSLSPKGWRYVWDLDQIEYFEYLVAISRERLELLQKQYKDYEVNKKTVTAARCRLIKQGEVDPVDPVGPSNVSQVKFQYLEGHNFYHPHWGLQLPPPPPDPFDLESA